MFKWRIYCVILLSVLVFNIRLAEPLMDMDKGVVIIPGWYGLDPADIDFCSRWGGTEESHSSYSTGGGDDPLLSVTTVSLQAKKLIYDVQGAAILYETSWYVEPIDGEVDYAVKFKGSTGVYPIADGKADNTGPGLGYFADYLDDDYSTVILEYGGNILELPIVEIT